MTEVGALLRAAKTDVLGPGPQNWGWGPVALRFAAWLYVDSVQFLDSVHSESDLLRRGGGEAPGDRQL